MVDFYTTRIPKRGRKDNSSTPGPEMKSIGVEYLTQDSGESWPIVEEGFDANLTHMILVGPVGGHAGE
jgi:hypothetical protein